MKIRQIHQVDLTEISMASKSQSQSPDGTIFYNDDHINPAVDLEVLHGQFMLTLPIITLNGNVFRPSS